DVESANGRRSRGRYRRGASARHASSVPDHGPLDQDQLAIKGEVSHAGRLERNFRVLSFVDENAQQVVLKANEIGALQSRARTDRVRRVRHPESEENKRRVRVVQEFLTALTKSRSWFKMPVKKLVMLPSSAEQRDAKAIKKLAKALKATGGLERLGQIVA